MRWQELLQNTLIKPLEPQIPVWQRILNQDIYKPGSPPAQARQSARALGEQVRQRVGQPFAQGAMQAFQKTGEKTQEIMNPGTSYLTPQLQKYGVNPTVAFGVGLGVDILAPGPGELKGGSKLLSKTDDLKPLIQEARKYKSAEEFVKAQTKSNSWSEAQKTNPDLWNKGILRKDIEPYGAKGVIPKEVHSAQGKWQNYGEFDEISADKVYKRIDSGSFKGEYEDKFGNAVRDNNGNVLQDVYDDATGEWIKPNVSNKELRNELLDAFSTKEGKQYLDEVINALPKNPDGTITVYRIGKIGGGEVQSYTLSEGMAKTFSNQGTSVLPAGTPGLPAKGYKDFGALPANMVKIDPKGIKAWSPYDAEILVEPKYVQTKSQLTDLWKQANKK